MKVLVLHNRYREAGGEDRVVERETALLAGRGHKVRTITADNSSIEGLSPVALAGRTIWSRDAYRRVRALLGRERVDVVHVHNTLPLLSPAVYYAAAAERVAVVQTLHNYRLLCANALLLRDGQPCEKCVGAHAPVAAVSHGCYRHSRSATGVVAAMQVLHRAAGTWQRKVDVYVATSEFARDKLVAGGLPADRLVVKPHFVDPDPGPGDGRGGYALFVGRLSKEKGIDTLLDAWSRLRTRLPLTIVGDGPLASVVADAAARLAGVTWLGRRTATDVQALMADAAVLVFPSIAYETFGQVVVEAYASGTPVVVSSGGAAAEMVEPGRTGVLVPPADPDRLAGEITRLFASTDALPSMRASARAAFLQRFSAERNYQALTSIYEAAIARRAVPPTRAKVVSPSLSAGHPRGVGSFVSEEAGR
jgi:glycosyltransferase involved in cell wall biosynthesis